VTASPNHLGYVLKRFPRLSETFIAAELLELRRQGQRVTVFALSRPDEPFTHHFLTELDVPVVYLPHRPLGELPRVLGATVRRAATHPAGWSAAAVSALNPPTLRGWRRLLQASALTCELRRAGVDHVHAHFASTAARLADLAHRMGGPPYSVTAHAKDIYHGEVNLDRLVDTLAAARFVATVSDANVDYLRGLLNGRGRVALVANSVDVARIRPHRSPQPRRVLTVARLVEKKGLDDLVKACGTLTRQGIAVHLDVVGDGPLRPQLEAVAAAEGVNATFAGALDNDEVLARYRNAAVFALPCVVAGNGDRDGLPTSVLEAMASEVPVVTTAVNGLADAVVHGRTGLIVPERDPAALAEAIGRLLTDPKLAATLGRAARQHVEDRFSLTASTARLCDLFADSRSAP
jgi:colanic acid/amylovoran biosynthesis glycosyltransferase